MADFWFIRTCRAFWAITTRITAGQRGEPSGPIGDPLDMQGEPPTSVTAIALPGSREPWERAGFACSSLGFLAGAVGVRLGSDAGRIVLEPPSALDGCGSSRATEATGEMAAGPHPNGVSGVDHVVVATPDMDRSREAFIEAGLDLRLDRQESRDGRDIRQAFFLAGPCVLELVASGGDRGLPAELWGITFVCEDLDRLPALEPPPAASIREAVQPGRRIAIADRVLGLPTRVAFMDPRTKTGKE